MKTSSALSILTAFAMSNLGCSQSPEVSSPTSSDGIVVTSSNIPTVAKHANLSSDLSDMSTMRTSITKIKIGDMAPMFDLASLDGNSRTNLSGLLGKKPVALIFGSYT